MSLIFDIRRFSVHDGPGIRTSVFFKGCPLLCSWCHNPESRSAEPECITRRNLLGKDSFEVQEMIGKQYSTEELMKEILRDQPFFEESGGGVTFTGGEPLIQAEALMPLLMSCREHNVHTAIDTSGYAPSPVFSEVAALNSLFLFDIKHSDNQKHIEITGVSNGLILNNLYSLKQGYNTVIIRIPLIPGLNTDNENLSGTLKILEDIRPLVLQVDLLPYHTLGRRKYELLEMQNSVYEEVTADTMRLWQNELESHGFINIVGG